MRIVQTFCTRKILLLGAIICTSLVSQISNASYTASSCVFSGTTVIGGMNIYTNFTCDGFNLGNAMVLGTGNNLWNPYDGISTEKGFLGGCSGNFNGSVFSSVNCPTTKYPFPTTGATGATGLSAYQLAVAYGFSGSEMQWIESLKGGTGATGATGATTHEIVFSTGQIFSGVQLSVNTGDNNAELNSGSTYIPVVAKNNGEYLVDSTGIRNVLFFLTILGMTLYFIIRFIFREKTL